MWSHHTIMLFCYTEKKILEYNSKSKYHLHPSLLQAVNFQWVAFASMSLFLIFFHEHLCSENVCICTFALVWAHVYVNVHVCAQCTFIDVCMPVMSETDVGIILNSSSTLFTETRSLNQTWYGKYVLVISICFSGFELQVGCHIHFIFSKFSVLSWSSYAGWGTQQPSITGL